MSKGKSKKLTPKEFLLCTVVVGLIFVFAYTTDRIINYPYYLWYYPTIAFSVIFFCIKLKANLVAAGNFKSLIDKALFFIFRVLIYLGWSICLVAILLIPFNYYNINYADRNPSREYNCTIVGVDNKSRSPGINYIFRNKINLINTSIPELDEMDTPEKYEQYYLVVTAKESLLGTYILKSWELRHK